VKTLTQHNEDVLGGLPVYVHPVEAGVSCPRCTHTQEMILVNPGYVLATCPPKQVVRCPECYHIDYKIVELQNA
jgi:hypothetical protein